MDTRFNRYMGLKKEFNDAQSQGGRLQRMMVLDEDPLPLKRSKYLKVAMLLIHRRLLNQYMSPPQSSHRHH